MDSAGSSEVVFQTLDVILAEIVAALHLDEHEVGVTGVADPMSTTHRNVERVADEEPARRTVKGHLGLATDDKPVLHSSHMALIAQPPSRPDLDSLHLVTRPVVKHRVRTPRTLVILADHPVIVPAPPLAANSTLTTPDSSTLACRQTPPRGTPLSPRKRSTLGIMTKAGTIRLGSHQVDRMGFGAMQLPGPGVFGPPRDPEQAGAVLRRVAELGIDHIDTAQFYGPKVANELLREVLHPYPAGLALVSKVGARRDGTGAWLPAQTPDELKAGVEENLSTLGVDRLAAVNLRRHDDGGTDFDAQLEAMIGMRDERLFDGIGLSSVSLEYLDRALTRTEIVCVQNAYNLADRASEPVLTRCEEVGITFVPFFPLGSAFAHENPVLGHPGVLKTAARMSATPAQVALAWLLAHSPSIALIPGTSSVRHLDENHAAADIELDEEAMSDIG